MCALISNNRGFTLIEMLIAIALTLIGIIGLLAMQPQGWSLSYRSDALGRANQILHEQLEISELHLMNPCNNAAPWGGVALLPGNGASVTDANRAVTSSGNAGVAGDYAFLVTTRITGTGTNTWRIMVQVTWTGNPTGIRESRDVTRQTPYVQGCIL